MRLALLLGEGNSELLLVAKSRVRLLRRCVLLNIWKFGKIRYLDNLPARAVWITNTPPVHIEMNGTHLKFAHDQPGGSRPIVGETLYYRKQIAHLENKSSIRFKLCKPVILQDAYLKSLSHLTSVNLILLYMALIDFFPLTQKLAFLQPVPKSIDYFHKWGKSLKRSQSYTGLFLTHSPDWDGWTGLQ